MGESDENDDSKEFFDHQTLAAIQNIIQKISQEL